MSGMLKHSTLKKPHNNNQPLSGVPMACRQAFELTFILQKDLPCPC